jgi:hypothetical protein
MGQDPGIFIRPLFGFGIVEFGIAADKTAILHEEKHPVAQNSRPLFFQMKEKRGDR